MMPDLPRRLMLRLTGSLYCGRRENHGDKERWSMHRWSIVCEGLVWIAVALGVTGCSSLTGVPATDSFSCDEVVTDLRTLTADLEVPDHFLEQGAAKRGGEFDVCSYFTVLKRLSMERGYVLDYVYLFQGLGGHPVLYARGVNQPPYSTYEELAREQPEPQGAYLEHVRTDGTPVGYLQFVMLAIMGEQFYLYWHACYNDLTPVCSKRALEKLLTELEDSFGQPMPPEDRERAQELQVEPWVVMGDEFVEVRVVVFTRWGGFLEGIYTIKRSYPHEIVETRFSTLVPYHCGVMF